MILPDDNNSKFRFSYELKQTKWNSYSLKKEKKFV
jgi:hypothetical protein